jgi:hypothetical protein
MADESWDEMSTAEKLESLHTDRKRMIDFINRLGMEIAQLRNQIVPKLDEVAKAAETVAAQMRELSGKQK